MVVGYTLYIGHFLECFHRKRYGGGVFAGGYLPADKEYYSEA